MVKKVTLILALLFYAVVPVWAMKKQLQVYAPQFVSDIAVANLTKRIKELAGKKDQATLSKLASFLFYMECLMETVHAEKLAAKSNNLDSLDFDEMIQKLIISINTLYQEIGDTDVQLLQDLDNSLALAYPGFNFKNFMVFVEARRIFAKHFNAFFGARCEILDFLKNKTAKNSLRANDYISVVNLIYGIYKVDERGVEGLKLLYQEYCKKTVFLDPSIFDERTRKTLLEFYEDTRKAIVNLEKTQSLCKVTSGTHCCACCGKKGKDLKCCSHCKIKYCNGECQLKDWPVHKKVCKTISSIYKDKENYNIVRNLVYKVNSASILCKKTFEIMEKKYAKLSAGFEKWYDDAKQFKLTCAKIYKTIHDCLDRDHKKISVGSRKGNKLPCGIFFLNEVICSNDVYVKKSFLRVLNCLLKKLEQTCDVRNKRYCYSIIHALELDEQKKIILGAQKRVRNPYLQAQLRRLFTLNVWRSHGNLTFLYPHTKGSNDPHTIFPHIYIKPTLEHYKNLIEKDLRRFKKIEDVSALPKSRKKRKKKVKKKPKQRTSEEIHIEPETSVQEPELQSSPRLSTTGEKSIGGSRVEGLVTSRIISEKERKRRYYAQLAQEIKESLFVWDEVHITDNGCICICQSWGPGVADGITTVLYPEDKHGVKNLDTLAMRDDRELYINQNKFHKFSYLVDNYLKKGYGKLITKSSDLPIYCQSPNQPTLESKGRFAIIIKGKLATVTNYHSLIKSRGVRRNETWNKTLFNGCFMYIFDKNKSKKPILIHRCFHKNSFSDQN